MVRFFVNGIVAITLVASAACGVWAQPPEAGDLVLGLGRSDGLASLELVRGPATEGGGVALNDPWDEPFIQSVAFDNLNNISHNPQGNLLGVTFGTSDDGGTIHSLATCSEVAADQLIGNTTGLGGDGVTLTRLGGLSISPDNSKIAAIGYDSGSVIVYDYTPGDCNGAGTALSNGRETPELTVPQFSTQGTTWLDAETVLAFATSGDLIQVNGATMDASVVAQVDTAGTGSQFTSAVYNPAVSPLLYLSYSTFDGGTTNSLYILNALEGFGVIEQLDLSTSANTLREIALDADGNLYLGQFGAAVDVLPNADDPNSVSDNSTIDWYIPETTASFSGLDVALGLSDADPDFNDDGAFDASDIDLLFNDIDAGNNTAIFDLNGDSLVDEGDVSEWLTQVGPLKGFSGAVRPGDVDVNGIVDAADLNVVGINWQSTTPAGWSQGDFNNDETVGAGDLNDLGLNWQSDISATAASAVPEPAALGLSLVALIACWQVRRRVD